MATLSVKGIARRLENLVSSGIALRRSIFRGLGGRFSVMEDLLPRQSGPTSLRLGLLSISYITADASWLGIIKDLSDLGSSFYHPRDGCVYFLFGDTGGDARDPIGRVKASSSGFDDLMTGHIDLPGVLNIPEISQGLFEVPTGGFSSGNRIHVFFTTKAKEEPRGVWHMGRCVLASAENPTDHFWVDVYVSSLPSLGGVGKFINVCPRVINAADHPELPHELTGGVMMWGSGDYRKSDVYLAFAPWDKVMDGSKSGWIYYAGDPSPSNWGKGKEEMAMPLLGETTVGELSVSFLPGPNLWIMMYGPAPAEPSRVWAKFALSPYPWGPWTKYQFAINRVTEYFFPQATRTWPYGFYIIDQFTNWNETEFGGKAYLFLAVSENDQDGGSGKYRTHLVRAVLQFDRGP